MRSISFVSIIARSFLVVGLVAFIGLPLNSQNTFEETIEQLSSENVRGYLQPMLDGFGANINSGFPGSARIKSLGLTFRLQIIAMGTLIGDAEKTYKATPPFPFPQTPVETATVFGGEGAVVQHPSGIEYKFQNGQIKTNIIPFLVPQLTIGDVFGTQATIRYVPVPSMDDFPQVTLFGIGVRHSVSQYLPLVPVDIAAGLFYQSFTVGDYIDTKATAFSAQVSKTLAVLTLYGGLQYESTNIDLSYTYTGPLPPGDESDRNVSLSLKGENKFRLTAGLGLSLGILHLHADVGIGKVTVLSAGLGFGI